MDVTERDMRRAEEIATQIQSFKDDNNMQNPKYMKVRHSEIETRKQGFLGEAVFERVFEGAVFDHAPHKEGDGGVDAVWRGMRFQIRCPFQIDSDLVIRYSYQVSRDIPRANVDHFLLIRKNSLNLGKFEMLFIPTDVATECIERVSYPDGFAEVVKAKNLLSAAKLLLDFWWQGSRRQ